MRLRKRTVGDQLLPIAHADAACSGNRMQLRAGEIIPARLDVFGELHVFTVNLALLRLVKLRPRLFVIVNQQHVLHFYCLLWFFVRLKVSLSTVRRMKFTRSTLAS